MIKAKKKICIDCQTEQYIWSHGRCKRCDAIYRANKTPVDIPEKPSEPLSFKSGRIPPLSKKRAQMEREYHIITGKMKTDARSDPNARCFFCNGKFRLDAPIDCHHLFGRVENLLVEKKNLVLVHDSCHRAYHNKSIHSINWYVEWMERIQISHPALYLKEKIKWDK